MVYIKPIAYICNYTYMSYLYGNTRIFSGSIGRYIALGLMGGGGSILTMPILVYVMRVNPVLATSYSLFIVGSTSMVGAYNNYRKGLVSVKTALLFGLSSITTVFLTRKILMPAIPAILFSTRHISISRNLC